MVDLGWMEELPTSNYPFIHKHPSNPNHDQQMHMLSKHKASTHSANPSSIKSMGFKNKNVDASTSKAKNPTKNPKDSHALGQQRKES